jgi:hypothetical protein
MLAAHKGEGASALDPKKYGRPLAKNPTRKNSSGHRPQRQTLGVERQEIHSINFSNGALFLREGIIKKWH